MGPSQNNTAGTFKNTEEVDNTVNLGMFYSKFKPTLVTVSLLRGWMLEGTGDNNTDVDGPDSCFT